ncbi:hypothetical protein DWY27_09355 [Clostridium sp. AF24-2LB]|nr:hypothetical protein [Clostridium sp.]RHQ66690.1 hypothetical protein DWY27_09355 [Clostridium sp. AF24-2LB]
MALEELCISKTIFIKQEAKSGVFFRIAAFFGEKIGAYCMDLTKNSHKLQNTTDSDWKILG